MKYKRIVVKIGSHLIVTGKEEFIDNIAKQTKVLKNEGCDLIIVSSGAIATGIEKYGLKKKPVSLVEKQAFAAIGQPLLMQEYISIFKNYDIIVSQVLLTRDDFNQRERYINIKNTLNFLLKLGVLPIINENDTVANEEIKLGDNDTLSAIVAVKLDADLLVLLTDVDGIYDKDPNVYPDAKIIQEIDDITELEKKCKVSSKSGFFCGTGGMKTKLDAAKICISNGVDVVITNGMLKNVLVDIYNNNKIGSWFYAKKDIKVSSRQKWIGFVSKPKGKIYIDQGAVSAIVKKHKSLLPVGIHRVEGKFEKGDVVSIYSTDGVEIARGIVNYDHTIVDIIKGKKSDEIKKIYPEFDTEEVVHVDNLVLVK